MVSFISLDLQHNGIQFHTTKTVSYKTSDMLDMENKKGPKYNKQKSKMVKKPEEDVQYNKKEKRNSSLEQLPNHFVTRINKKNDQIIENNFSTPKRVAIISTYYKSEHNPRQTNLHDEDVKILKLLTKK